MFRSLGILPLAAVAALPFTTARADEQQVLQQLQEVRALVEQQAKQIDALTMQVSRLNQYLGARFGAVPAGDAPIEAPRAEPVEKAAPAEEGRRHIIVKGDNLTTIAKHYNVPLGELQKANKNVNPSKLQIGQSILIPNVTKTEQPAEKKDTP